MKNYIAIYITAGSKPFIVWRFTNSKGWATRFLNGEDYKAECAKDFTSKYRLVIESQGLSGHIENMTVTSRWEDFTKKQLVTLKELLGL